MGKPPKIARPPVRSASGSASRSTGSTKTRSAPRPVGARPAAGEARTPGATPVRRPRPKPEQVAADSALREKTLVGLGNLLKTKREIHGLTRRDVVVKIKIPLEQLEAIEDGRLSSLPPVFAKGFLRAYANELDLDAESILEDYRQMTGGFKNEPASREPLNSRYLESNVGGGSGSGLKGLLVTLGVLAVLALVIVLWPGLRHTLGSAVPFLGQVPGFSADASAAKTTAGTGETEATAGDGETVDAGSADDGFVGDPTAETEGDKAVIGAINAPPRSEPKGGTLILSCKEDKVWVEVVVDGEFREYLLLSAGQKVGWASKKQITITSGQANAISVNWNGQDIGPLSDKTVDEVTFPRG